MKWHETVTRWRLENTPDVVTIQNFASREKRFLRMGHMMKGMKL